MNHPRLAGALSLVLTAPLLAGCTAGAVALQAIPMAVGTVALANAEQLDPFETRTGQPMPADVDQDVDEDVDELGELAQRLHQAECGDAEAQYWLAGALRNDFNATPDHIEIYKWYRLAELGEFAPASRELVALHETMSALEIAEAGRRAGAWQPIDEGCPPRA